MRPKSVIVAATQVPFQRGGAEWHAQALRQQLGARGFQSDLVQVPFQWTPRREVLKNCLAWRLLDLTQSGGVPIDLVIATRFPSYAVSHPNKIVWLFHPFRQAYDLHDAGIDGFEDTPDGRSLHARVVELDTRLLRECRRVFTTSANNAARLLKYNGIHADVLHVPLLDTERWRCEAWEDYVLFVGRLESLKRPDLLVRAAAHLRAPTRTVLVGEGSQERPLRDLARSLGVEGRVEFRGYVDDAEVKALYARCSAVFYAPYDEDYGLVTLEAFHSRKPVVTTSDAGGVLEFVRDGENGLVTAPDPVAIAEGLDRLLADPSRAREWGENGYERVRSLRWDHVIDVLTAETS